MFIIPSINLSMKLSLSEVFVSNIIVTIIISNKSCCKHVLVMNLLDFISTATRVTSVKYKKVPFGFLFSGEVWYCSQKLHIILVNSPLLYFFSFIVILKEKTLVHHWPSSREKVAENLYCRNAERIFLKTASSNNYIFESG